MECRWVLDATDLDEWASKIDRHTRFLYGELPSNPQLGFFDIEAVADLAHSHNLPLICDSTDSHAGAVSSHLPRRGHRCAIRHQEPYQQRVRRLRRGHSAEEPGDQH